MLIPAVVVTVRHWGEDLTNPETVRFQIQTARMRGNGLLSASPDGHRVAYVAPNAEGRPVLWVRALDSLTPEALPGTEGASWRFWSPTVVLSDSELTTV
jgi:hypothetical protein